MSVVKFQGDVGFLQLPQTSLPMLHLHTGHQVGADLFSKHLPMISDKAGLQIHELEEILVQEGLAVSQVRIGKEYNKS